MLSTHVTTLCNGVPRPQLHIWFVIFLKSNLEIRPWPCLVTIQNPPIWHPPMGRPKKWRIHSAACARASKQAVRHSNDLTSDTSDIEEMPAYDLTDSDEMTWTGGVNHTPDSDNSDFSWEEDSSPSETDDNDDLDLDQRLSRGFEHKLRLLTEKLMTARNFSKAEWRKAERNCGFRYTRYSVWSVQRREKVAREKEVKDAKLRKT